VWAMVWQGVVFVDVDSGADADAVADADADAEFGMVDLPLAAECCTRLTCRDSSRSLRRHISGILSSSIIVKERRGACVVSCVDVDIRYFLSKGYNSPE
jgi:hypothetical protein